MLLVVVGVGVLCGASSQAALCAPPWQQHRLAMGCVVAPADSAWQC